MKACFKLMLGLVVLGLLLVGYALLATGQERAESSESAQSEDPPAQETYVSEVIIQAPWGEKNLLYDNEESPPGEFGMHEEFQEPGATEGLIIGPNTFTVAPDGDIYINDPLNKRIQRFGPNGEFISVIPIEGGFICVDKDDNIYTTRASRPHWFIDKFDQTGNLLKSYPIEIEKRGLYGIHCDNSGRLFMEFYYRYMKVDKETRTITDTTWHGICQVADAARGFSLEEQKSLTRREAYFGSNSATLEKGLFLMPDRSLVWGYGNLYLVNLAGDTVGVFKSLHGSLLGCDEDLNVYTHQYDEKNHAMVGRKYSPEGELISTFEYWCGKPYTGIYTLRGCALLDFRGNLYVFCQSYKDGVKVIKWYKAD